MKKYIYTLLSLLFLAGCSEYDPDVNVGPVPELNALDVLKANDYAILVSALEQTAFDLGTSPVTIFAPTNEAFQKLFMELGVNSIGEIDNSVLSQVLSYHVVNGELLSSDLTSGPQTTLSGSVLNVVVTGSGDDLLININGKASVVDADRVSTNGAIHGINQVLSEPAGNMVEVLAADPNFSFLSAAIVHAGLDGALSGSNEFTLLAPDNDAFINAGFNDIDSINSTDPAVLADVLSFHVISGKIFSQQLPSSAKVATILGAESEGQEELIIEDTDIKTYLFPGSQLSVSSVELTNVLATNGVIHGTDNMLFELGTVFDFMDPDSNTLKTSGDDGSPNALDNLGTIVEGLNYSRLLSITDTSTVFIPFDAPPYTSFATDADALAFLEAHTFKGFVNFADLDNGDKVKSLSNDEYYIAVDASGFAYVNGLSGNIITSSGPGFVYDHYNGNTFRFSSTFIPIPETNIVDVLNANGYDMMAAALLITEKNEDLDAGDNTFFTVSNAVLSSYIGLPNAAAIEALDPDVEDDAGLIAELAGVIDIHTLTEVDFAVYLTTEFPTVTAVSGDELFFAENGGDAVIILDNKDPDNNQVNIVDIDFLYSNGVVHELDQVIEF